MSNRIIKASYINLDAEVPIQINNMGSLPQIVTPSEEIKFVADLPFDMGLNEEELAAMDPMQLEVSILARARQEAEKIIQSAHEDANSIIDKLETEARQRIELNYEEAYDKGYNEGYNTGLADAEEIKEQARMVYAKAVEERETMIREMEPEAIQLIVDILDKLITDSIDISPNIIIHLIRKGFSDSKLTGDITIHVSEEDYQEVCDNQDEILRYAEAGSKVDIVKDYSLKKADCIIETPFGAIDCSLDMQYVSLRQNLYFIFENR